MATETRITPWVAFSGWGVTAYRIWQRRDEFGMHQRHEWRTPEGTTTRDAWIKGVSEFVPTAVAVSSDAKAA